MNKNLLRRYQMCLMVLTLTGLLLVKANGLPALPEGRNVGVGLDSEGLYLTLPGIQDATYGIEEARSVLSNQWEQIGGFDATDGLNIYRPPATNAPTRFFRGLFPQPTLAAVEPVFVSGTGEDTVYVTGQYFYEGDVIRVGGVILSNVTFISSTMLSGTLSSQVPGLHDVEVISGQNDNVLALLPGAIEVAPSLRRTLQEPAGWPPAGPAPVFFGGKKGYDYYQALGDSSSSYLDDDDDGDWVPTAWYPDCDGDNDYPQAGAGSAYRFYNKRKLAQAGLYGTASNYLDPDDDGDTVQTAQEAVDSDDDGYGDMGLRLHSGEIQQQVADLVVPGRGLDFIWVRTYRSRTGEDSPQGTRWSHSYDVRCVQENGVVHLFDGTGRKDTFRQQADGAYTCPGIFREGTLTDGTFRLTFADTGFWEFNPLATGGTSDGKLARIQDRNGNALTCDYDEAGRLVHVVDTLGRTNSIAYNANDRVASVTDCTGRTVTYAYYTAAESGGTGDLKSVTSPAVTGTPNKNDFPSGKTVSYTYTSLIFDDYESHRLHTVIDGNGLSAVTFEYDIDLASTTFERCVSVQRGTEAPTRITYLPQAPAPANSFAAMRCIVNDPVGNVTESFFDLRNRCVMQRRYTGRAVAGQPVTDTQNRPTGQLRTSYDPVFYEITYFSNNDNLCTSVTLPGGSTCRFVYAGDVDPGTRARKRADLLTQEWDAKATGGADTDGDGSPDLYKIAYHYTHDPRFGSDPARGYWDCDGDDNGVALTRGWNGTYKGKLSYYRDNDCGGEDEDCDGIDNDCDGFVTSATDPRGTVTTALYDERGNLIRSAVNIEDGPVMDLAYNAHGQCTAITNAVDANGLRRVDTIQWGTCPEVVVRDASGNPLTTTFEYDERCNVTRFIDPNGNDTLFVYNALDQLVTRSSPPYGEKGDQRVTTTLFYDANDNVVRVDTDNRRDTGDPVADNPIWSDGFEYDALDRCIAATREVSSTASITNRYEYDANGRLTARISPLAVAGTEPLNRVEYQYDERDLLFRTIEAPGSSVAATNERAYTADGRPATVRYADGSVALYAYDGFSRVTTATDARGNNINWFFSGAGDLTRCRVMGEITDVPGSAGNRRLSESSWSYDGLGRCTYQIDSFFDVFTELSIDDGARTTQFTYAPSGQRTTMVNDLGATNFYIYDTAGRLTSVIGPRGDTSACLRDANGNVTRRTTSSLSDLGGNPQQFSCDYTYDGLDRRISAVDNVGNTNLWFYDSRNLLSRSTDPRGNEIRYLYDGLSRAEGSISYVGPCDAGPDGTDRGITINTSHVEYDANSRITTVTDVNTNSTTHTYDLRNRLVGTTDPVGRAYIYSRNSSGMLSSEQDPNGTVVTYSYDPLNRLIRKDIAPGAGISPATTFETFAYDGLSRCVAASNNISNATYTHDSLGNLTRTVKDGAPVLFTRNTLGERLALTYPSGVTSLYTYDPLHQVKSVSVVSNGAPPLLLATYDYDGPGRLARINRIDGTATEILWNGLVSQPNPAGDYGWQGVAAISHGAVGGGAGGLIDERVYNYDRSQNKTLRAQTHAFDPATGSAITNIWAHDALSQSYLARKISAAGENTLTYVFDGKGNRLTVTNDTVPEIYTRSATIPPGDFQMDQYTTTPYGSNTYDAVGNLVENTGPLGSLFYTFDYAGRLVEVSAPGAAGTPEPVVSFGYDAFGQRISKTIYPAGQAPETTTYLCNGKDNDCDGTTDDDAILETYVGSTRTSLHIYGGGGAGGGVRMFSPPIMIINAAGDPLFTRCDELGNVLALTDAGGAVLERYEYGDFGEPEFLAADGSPLIDRAGTPLTSSPAGNTYLFGGMQWDSETALYLGKNHARYFKSRTGQYFSQNAGGDVILRSVQLDGSRAFANNNPWTEGNKEGGYRDGSDLYLRKRPGRTRATDHNASRSNQTSSNIAPGGGDDLILRKRPGRVKYGDITLKRGVALIVPVAINKRRTGRNPQTGKEIKIAAKNVVRFKAGADLSGKVN